MKSLERLAISMGDDLRTEGFTDESPLLNAEIFAAKRTSPYDTKKTDAWRKHGNTRTRTLVSM